MVKWSTLFHCFCFSVFVVDTPCLPLPIAPTLSLYNWWVVKQRYESHPGSLESALKALKRCLVVIGNEGREGWTEAEIWRDRETGRENKTLKERISDWLGEKSDSLLARSGQCECIMCITRLDNNASINIKSLHQVSLQTHTVCVTYLIVIIHQVFL